MTTTLKTRKPTGRVPWPLVLLEGGEKSGKSWTLAQFSASPRVGPTYVIDLSEGTFDEYGAIPGVRYELVEHDGTWRNLLAAVQEVRDEARKTAEAGGPPVVLGIDSMTHVWELLKDWATARARNSNFNKKKLRDDPDAEIDVSANYWNDANERHRRLMTLLMTFPGVAVITARGKDTMAIDANGRPIAGQRDYRVQAQKDVGYDATVWVRMSREHAPLIVGARSVHAGLVPGRDKPQPLRDFSLEWLVFEHLRCDPAAAHVRDLRPHRADPNDRDTPPPDEREVEAWLGHITETIADAPSEDQLRGPIWKEILAKRDTGFIAPEVVAELTGLLTARRDQLRNDLTQQDQPVGASA